MKPFLADAVVSFELRDGRIFEGDADDMAEICLLVETPSQNLDRDVPGFARVSDRGSATSDGKDH